MTPHALSDPSFLELAEFTPHAATDLALLDDETFLVVYEAVVAIILDFLRYATAYNQGTIAELLNDEPQLAMLGQALLGGLTGGIIVRTGNLQLWCDYERHGIVIDMFAFDCNG